MQLSTILQVLLSACFFGRIYGQERVSLFLRNGIINRLSGDADHHKKDDPEDAFGTRSSSFGPCVTDVGSGKCTSQEGAYYNFCRKNNISLEDCQTSVSKLELAIGIDYESTSKSCFALFPGVGLTKDDLEVACPDAEEIAFYYPETFGIPVDANSGVPEIDCFRCARV